MVKELIMEKEPNVNKAEQVLILEPATELHFVGPFTDVVTSTLKLVNPLDRRVCFKVKTTAPKKYCVRPNSGVLKPKQVINVAVMLQPFDYNPNEKNKHKFMVQTMIVPDGDVNIDNLWQNPPPESLMDSKLRCVFDMPEETVKNNNLDTNAVQGEDKTAVSKVVTEPTVKTFPKASNIESELKKIYDENKTLKKEIELLNRENEQLRAEEQRLRQRGNPKSDAGSQLRAHHLGGSKDAPSKPHFDDRLQEQPQSPMLYLAVMLTIGLVGIFIGKFVV
ncbi:vesicle-associated membrane protein-associated protein B-like isoform X1 [Uloborus diversus]|uniref:vesicle-associated membrane protein-associated protein B-like isoform X1 n=1 Tax=Uloborus diversus TaxID=327109 RepID=UPI002409DED3|nr:vesicle-associated membrane protein-associated protein B-like isoform X1 [Uloborus diversus]